MSNIRLVHEPGFFMLIPLIILCFCSIFAGYMFKDVFIGAGVTTWSTSFPNSDVRISSIPSNFIQEILFGPHGSLFLRLLPFLISMFVLLALVVFYNILNGSLVVSKFNEIYE